jgi:hypothetical protein
MDKDGNDEGGHYDDEATPGKKLRVWLLFTRL